MLPNGISSSSGTGSGRKKPSSSLGNLASCAPYAASAAVGSGSVKLASCWPVRKSTNLAPGRVRLAAFLNLTPSRVKKFLTMSRSWKTTTP